MNRMLKTLVAGAILGLAAPALADTAFFRELAEKTAVTFADGYTAMVMLHGGERAPVDYATCVQALRKANIIPASWETAFRPEDALSREKLAYMICRTVKLRGGVNLSWTRVARATALETHYALRECVFLEIIPKGTEYKRLTGDELIVILDRAAEFKDAAGKPKAREDEEVKRQFDEAEGKAPAAPEAAPKPEGAAPAPAEPAPAEAAPAPAK
ncbi:MAG: hypothetical protein V1809_10175 [Planctomycetota bacterium]